MFGNAEGEADVEPFLNARAAASMLVPVRRKVT